MTVVAKERLYLNADKTKLVPEGDGRAAFLYASPGDEIPDSAAALFGLDVVELKEEKPARNKEDKRGKDKERKGGRDKGGKPTVSPSQLSTLHGVGPETIEALNGAGIADLAGLAALDAESPPAIEGLPSGFDWPGTIGRAKQLTDLGAIEGIGPATAAVLSTAGVATVADLSGLDPEQLPEVNGLPANFDFPAAIDRARVAVASVGTVEG